MRNLSKTFIFSLLSLFIFWGKETQAQPISPVHQDNLPTFMDDLDNYFGMTIQVPMTSIQNYLAALLPLNGNGQCHEPEVEMTDVNSGAIRFDWLPVNGASKFRTGYLNLITGAHQEYETNDYFFNFNLNDGLYLFFFQSYCNGKWSRADIIIIEKVIHLEINKNLKCNCQFGTQEIANPDQIDNLSVYDEFDILVFNGESLNYKAHLKIQPYAVYTTYDINPFCGRGNILIDGEVFYTTPLDGAFFFEIDAIDNLTLNTDNFMQTVKIGLCNSSHIHNENGTVHLNIDDSNFVYPNPFNGHLNINMENNKHQETIIELVDFSGNVVFQDKHIEHTNFITIDSSQLPSGLYFLKIKNGANQAIKKIWKAEN